MSHIPARSEKPRRIVDNAQLTTDRYMSVEYSVGTLTSATGGAHEKRRAKSPQPLEIRWLGAAAGAAITLAPVGAHAQNAQPPLSLPALAPPANGPLYFNPPPAVVSWLDMVSATQAAQPNWMTPLVTVTPRLEQELRADFYDQQNGTGSQGNGQRIQNYGGPVGSGWSLSPPTTWK